jgi:hypothetical protein
MNGKVSLTLLASAVLAFACGPRARNETASSPTESTRNAASADPNSPLASSLDVSVEDGVRFEFAIVNASKKKLEVNFADGRTHDVVVFDANGREVWRWSEGKMFTQAVQNRVLRTTDAIRFEEAWQDPLPGSYVAVATLASANYPVERRVEFVVRQ